MNIYRLNRKDDVSNGYDEYNAAIVYANDAPSARLMHPKDGKPINAGEHLKANGAQWPTDPALIRVDYIGIARTRMRPGVILSDFHEG